MGKTVETIIAWCIVGGIFLLGKKYGEIKTQAAVEHAILHSIKEVIEKKEETNRREGEEAREV